MKRILFTLLALLCSVTLFAQEFEERFEDVTLRIDYTFSGNASEQYVALDRLSATETYGHGCQSDDRRCG